MKLRKLEIRRWRALAEPVVLEFHDGINVVLGKNGTGKSNLLELLAQVTSMPYLHREPVDLTATFARGGVEADLVVRVGRTPAPQSGQEPDLVGEVVVREPGEKERRTSFEDHIQLLRAWSSIPDSLSRLEIGSFWFNSDQPFDEALDFWQRVAGRSPAGREAVLKRRPNGVESYLVPLHFLFGSPNKLADVDQWSSSSSSLLTSYAALIGAQELQMTPRWVRTEDGVRHYERFDLRVRYDERNEVSGDLLSFGEKRLFAFLWYCALNPTAIVADELTNGLHHGWIGACLEQIGDRQAFLAVQNPLVLDFLTFGSDEELRRAVLCDHAAPGSGGRWRWRQLEDSGASELFQSWKAEWEHLSEILISHGVW